MENEIEIWKDIPGYEGVYQASTFGRIKGLERIVVANTKNPHTRPLKEKIIKPRMRKGYGFISLHKNGEPIEVFIHQLIATTFLNHNRSGYDLIVHHVNGIKTDNALSNLSIETQRFNTSEWQCKTNVSSKYTGVRWNHNKWEANIRYHQKKRYISEGLLMK